MSVFFVFSLNFLLTKTQWRKELIRLFQLLDFVRNHPGCPSSPDPGLFIYKLLCCFQKST